MKIALVSTCAVAVPPPGYGGIERFVATLSTGLTERGHRVTVYATGDSRPGCNLWYRFAKPAWPPDYGIEAEHARNAWRHIAASYADVVHLNLPDALQPVDGVLQPVVLTLHMPAEAHLVRMCARYPQVNFAAVSQHQANTFSLPAVPSVIHHGEDPESVPFGRGRGGYALFLGRIGPEKAPHLAIDAAVKAGYPLIVGGPHWKGRSCYDRYFHHEFLPRLARHSASVRWLGELDQATKLQLLQGADALLMPMDWDEPFGRVMIESMFAGAPVIAFARGSAPEVVDEGITGMLVADVEEMAAALHRVSKLDRWRCRLWAIERFNVKKMVQAYEALYAAAIKRHEHTLAW